jgi:hypothetical protein
MHKRSYCKRQLEEDSVARHKGERKVKTQDDDLESIADSIATESDMTMDTENVLLLSSLLSSHCSTLTLVPSSYLSLCGKSRS